MVKKIWGLLPIGILFAFVFNAFFYTTETYATSCINNTKDEAQCKDCCDCMDTDAVGRSSCRDACAVHAFSSNSDFITVTAPSTLGPNGDYSAALNSSTIQECKLYCDGSSTLACGDRRYCRDQCNAKYAGSDQNNSNSNGNGISIEQAISDEAQRNTIAFDSLAFMTGYICCDTFLPPGKVADFSGFQYFRDTDPTNMGHNTDFVTIIAYNILNIMTADQRATLINLASSQIAQISQYGYGRFPLIKAFRRLIDGDIPTGSTGLDKNAVMDYSGQLYRLDGQISYERARVLGSIIRGMTNEQKAKIDALTALSGIGNWDKTVTDPLKSLNLTPAVSVAVMTYASEMYSWYAGSVYADTYFCPERQGTYFGSFYMKDAPAMAAGSNFTIPDTLTADMGNNFLGILTTDQAALVNDLVTIQKSDLLGIVDKRQTISTELRKFMVQSSVDESTVLSLAEEYGKLDGAIIYNYASNFVQVSKTLSAAQKTALTALRGTWNTIPCTGAYLYSEHLTAMPDIPNTDFLFTQNPTSSPTISFVFSPSAPAPGQTVSFTDISTGSSTSWLWSFGDGSTSTEKNPFHAFATANIYTVSLTATNANGSSSESKSITVTNEGASTVTSGSIVKLADGFLFTEGPASDAVGNVFFSDITTNKIYKWSIDGQLSTFKTDTGGANGLFFDAHNNLITCEGANGRVVSINAQGNVTVLADKYNGLRFNEPNDLWIDAKGGMYFSDPLYFGNTLYQDGEYVYYLTPKRDKIILVVKDMVKPNGIIGSPDGKTLYVADHGAAKTYRYTINQNGSLSNKTLFASSGSDGMTIDNQGNVYLTTGNSILVYNSSGSLIETITVPVQPTNVCFGGMNRQTLFITAKTSVYWLPMKVKGVSSFVQSAAGDINGDGKMDLADAVIALQVVTGLPITESVNPAADVNGDGRIGMVEAIYCIQKISGMR